MVFVDDSVALPLLVLALDLDLPPKANASRSSCVGEGTAGGLNSLWLARLRTSISGRPNCSPYSHAFSSSRGESAEIIVSMVSYDPTSDAIGEGSTDWIEGESKESKLR